MKLSVLEHGHINEGRSVQDTLQETVKLAQHADQLGYSRFWMSEHHGSGALSFSSPEVMIAHVVRTYGSNSRRFRWRYATSL